MNDEIRKFLFDVLLASEDIRSFTEGLDFSAYLKNKMVQRAVEREFEIIGEALNRIKKVDPELLEQVSAYHRIIGFRNILSHGYDIIDENWFGMLSISIYQFLYKRSKNYNNKYSDNTFGTV